MSIKNKWRWLVTNFVSTFLLVLLVASCTATTNTGNNSTGGTEGTITVYTALEDDQIAGYLPQFEKAHPEIKVNIVRDSTGIVTAKLLAEKDNPRADLVWGTAVTSLLLADRQGLLKAYAPQGLENVRPEFRDERDPPHWVGIDAWMSAFCVFPQ